MPRIFEIDGQGVTILLDTVTDIGNIPVQVEDVQDQNGYSLDFSKAKNSFYLSINSF